MFSGPSCCFNLNERNGAPAWVPVLWTPRPLGSMQFYWLQSQSLLSGWVELYYQVRMILPSQLLLSCCYHTDHRSSEVIVIIISTFKRAPCTMFVLPSYSVLLETFLEGLPPCFYLKLHAKEQLVLYFFYITCKYFPPLISSSLRNFNMWPN